jgi:K+/H+ antiporter YhaU regulatory subunit KhtT
MSVRGMDLYQVDLPAKMIGKSFADVLENLKRSKDSIAVGIVRRKETIINPEGGMVLEEGDKLLVIAREKVTTF